MAANLKFPFLFLPRLEEEEKKERRGAGGPPAPRSRASRRRRPARSPAWRACSPSPPRSGRAPRRPRRVQALITLGTRYQVSKISKIRIFFVNFWQARSRLYQKEILQVNLRLTAFFKFYKMCTLLHRSKLNILAKKRLKKAAFCEISALNIFRSKSAFFCHFFLNSIRY